MRCSEYLTAWSEFRDGRAGEAEKGEVEDHLASCPRCRRHHEALEKGVDLLRSFPLLDVPEDFKPRLSHRIYHVEDGASIARGTLGSGATTLSVLAVALLLAFAAWTPKAGLSGPSVELPAVVVGTPPLRSLTAVPGRSTFRRGPSLFTTAQFQDGPWGDSHQTLFEYSSLSERRRGSALSRVGVQ